MATSIRVNIGSANELLPEARSHYLNKCGIVINGLCGMVVRPIAQEVLNLSIREMRLKT